MTTVAVLTGGSSPERDVALAGAAQVVTALRARQYEVRVVDTVEGELSAEAERRLLAARVGALPPTPEVLASFATREAELILTELPAIRWAELVFPVLHGRQGEGGSMQAMLEARGIPYAGSGPVGSTVAMDKDIAKRLFRDAGITTPRWLLWPASEQAIAALGFPLIIKPSNVGSTVGLTVVQALDEVEGAVRHAMQFDDDVLVEAFLPGREFTVGVLGNEALAVGEIIPSHAIFDYECKYTPGMTEEVFPADVPGELATELRALALRAHRALRLHDFSRADFRLAEDGTPHCLEVNTLPGLTPTSLLPQSAAAVGIPFDELCHRICQLALGRWRSRNKAPAQGM